MTEIKGSLFRIFEALPLPVFIWDEKGEIIFWNTRAQSEFGWDKDYVLGREVCEVIGIKIEDLEPSSNHVSFDKDITTVKRLRIRTIEGNIRVCEIYSLLFSANSTRTLGVSMVKNISKMEKLQAKVYKNRHYASLGHLISKIAHEVNNLLTGLIGYLSIARGSKSEEEIKNNLVPAVSVARRIKSLVNSLLSESRSSSNVKGKIDVNDVVKSVAEFSRNILPQNIFVYVETSASKPSIEGDENLFHQILLNLILNAKDAIKNKGTVSIEISLENSGDFIEEELEEKHVVAVSVKDTGCGMRKAVKERIFEPFFTTKENSGGTGLGLNFVYDSVKKMGGWIEVESEPGKGSRFTVYIPEAK